MGVPKWNEIEYNEDAPPSVKAFEFDAQVQENGGPTIAETAAQIERQQTGEE